MFEDLLDQFSLLFAWRWPVTDGEVTAADIERIHDGESVRLSVAYKFSVGEDGPYIGEAYWQPNFSLHLAEKMRNAKKQMHAGRQIRVRYRPKNPSVNRLMGSISQYIE